MKRPNLTRKKLLDWIAKEYPEVALPDFFTCGIRGYYRDTMGKAGTNDRNIYDDAAFVVGKDKEDFFAFNGNTDPAAFRKSIASLKPGIWKVYKFDMHKGQYMALCQRGGPVTVIRDGVGEDTGNFGINQHRGGNWGTSSLGCQTTPPDEYDEWYEKCKMLAKKYYGNAWSSKSDYWLILLENTAQTNAAMADPGITS
jgi:hypothetical protein